MSALSLLSEGGFRHTALEPHSNQMFSESSTVSKPGAGPETSASAHTTTLRGSNKDSFTRETHFRGSGWLRKWFCGHVSDGARRPETKRFSSPLWAGDLYNCCYLWQ